MSTKLLSCFMIMIMWLMSTPRMVRRLCAAVNTYSETDAIEVIRQYNRGFGPRTNRLSCVITGWNQYEKPTRTSCCSACERRKSAVL